MEWLTLVHGSSTPAPPAVNPGDEVRVWFRILEQGRERLGQFEGTIIRVRGSAPSKTFTVRRVTYGEGVERVFPMDSKMVSRIEVLRRGTVRRSRLYFLRRAIGKTRIASTDAADAQAAAERAENAEPQPAAQGAAQPPAAEKPSGSQTPQP